MTDASRWLDQTNKGWINSDRRDQKRQAKIMARRISVKFEKHIKEGREKKILPTRVLEGCRQNEQN